MQKHTVIIMIEEIALSISTVLFFLCTLVVSSVIPEVPVNSDEPNAYVSEIGNEATPTMASHADTFTLEGEWNNGGRSFIFTNDGKVMFDSHKATYVIDGNTVRINTEIGGSQRTFSLLLEVLEPRVMRLNGVTFYKIK